MMGTFKICTISFLFIYLNIQTTSAKNCTCVPFFQCSNENNNIISDGSGLIEIRNAEPCEGVFEVCCNTTLVTTTPALPMAPMGCGVHPPATFPWNSALLYKQYPNFVASHRCRVALIHPWFAITAAHCLQPEGYFQVRIGGVIRAVSNMTIHPRFQASSLHNDVALLILAKPFNIDKVGTVCLPTPGYHPSGRCYTATKSKDSSIFKITEVKVLLKKECQEKFRESRLGRFFLLHDSFICVEAEEEDGVCGGDGGGALVCEVEGVKDRYQLVGVVSWGIGCGEGFPVAFVDLGSQRRWVDEIVKVRGLDPDFYKL